MLPGQGGGAPRPTAQRSKVRRKNRKPPAPPPRRVSRVISEPKRVRRAVASIPAPHVPRRVSRPSSRGVVRRRTTSSSAAARRASTISRARRASVSRAKTSKAKKSTVPSLAKYLSGDLTYQQQLRRFGKTWADFLAEYGRQRGDIVTEAGVAQRGLEDQRTKDLKDILYNYAGRGMLHSGTYATGRSEYETEFGKQASELERQKTKGLSSLTAEKTKFQGEQTLARQEAREEAIRRRAQKRALTRK